MTYTPTATIEAREDEIVVRTIWSGPNLDRTDGHAWAFSDRSMPLAKRLVRAIEAGAAFGTPELRTDARGKTYVTADPKVFGRKANADLRRLGF